MLQYIRRKQNNINSKRQRRISLIKNQNTNVIFSVSKLTIVEMKLSFITADRIPFHVSAFSPRSMQIDSKAILTTDGGFAIDLTSTSCCFLIERTAVVYLDV